MDKNDYVLNEKGKVVRATRGGVTVYPYRQKMKKVQDVGGYRWVSDGWDNCSGQYSPAYLTRLLNEGKAIWA